MKISITSERLIEMGVDIVDFVQNGPMDAIHDAARDIGDRKGWGSEGSGELAIEFMNELGFYNDKEMCEDWCDLEEGDEVLLDGVDVRKFDVSAMEREQLEKREKELIEELERVRTSLKFIACTSSE